jgi:predicted nucleic acid-binding protein
VELPVAIDAASAKQWLRIAPVQDSPLLRALMVQLHRGEAEAIPPAAEIRADMVLIDEQEWRQLAT